MSEDTNYSLKEYYADQITRANTITLDAARLEATAFRLCVDVGTESIDGKLELVIAFKLEFVIAFQTDASKITRNIAATASKYYYESMSSSYPDAHPDTQEDYHIAKGYHTTRAYQGYAIADLYIEAAKYIDVSAYTYVQTLSSTLDAKTISMGILNIVKRASGFRAIAKAYRVAARANGDAVEAYADVINSHALAELTPETGLDAKDTDMRAKKIAEAKVIKIQSFDAAENMFAIAKTKAFNTFTENKLAAFDVYSASRDDAFIIFRVKGTDLNAKDTYEKAIEDAFERYDQAKAEYFEIYSQAKSDAFDVYSQAKADAFDVYSQAHKQS